MGHPLGRALFEDAAATRPTPVRTGVVGYMFPERDDANHSWEAAATKLGIPYEEYAAHRESGELWCSVARHWVASERFRRGARSACRVHEGKGKGAMRGPDGEGG